MIHLGVLAFLIFPALLLLRTRRDRFAGSPWPAALAFLFFGGAHVREALANIRAPREWDFGSFWLYARVARMHENLYDPVVFQRVNLPFPIDRSFRAAVLQVGFPYPPPTIALFLPLGAFGGVASGLAFWYAAQLVALAVAAVALGRAFFPRAGARGPLLVGALLVLLPALGTNTSHAQTNAFLLALVALSFLHRGRAWGAGWTALAIWVKPYSIALLLFDLATRRWQRLAVATFVLVVSLAASLALLGRDTFVSYFSSNPSLREPASSFTESSNQSLLAAILRATHADLGAHLVLAQQPFYLAAAASLVAVTLVLCARFRMRDDLCFSLTLLLGLLVYPATLESYGTVAILPILVLWSRRDELPLREGGVALLAGAVILLQGPFHAGFLANALLWLCTAVALAWLRSARPEIGNGPEHAQRSRPLSTAV